MQLLSTLGTLILAFTWTSHYCNSVVPNACIQFRYFVYQSFAVNFLTIIHHCPSRSAQICFFVFVFSQLQYKFATYFFFIQGRDKIVAYIFSQGWHSVIFFVIRFPMFPGQCFIFWTTSCCVTLRLKLQSRFVQMQLMFCKCSQLRPQRKVHFI